MIESLLWFLLAALVLVIVLYVCRLVLDRIPLPPEIKQVVYLILGLIALLVIISLALQAFHVGPLWR